MLVKPEKANNPELFIVTAAANFGEVRGIVVQVVQTIVRSKSANMWVQWQSEGVAERAGPGAQSKER